MCNALDVTTNAQIGGVLTSDRVNVLTTLTSPRIDTYIFSVNNQFGTPATINGQLTVYDLVNDTATMGVISAADITTVALQVNGLATMGVVDAGEVTALNFIAPSASIIDILAVTVTASTLEAFNVTIIPDPLDPLNFPGTLETPTAAIGLLVVAISIFTPIIAVGGNMTASTATIGALTATSAVVDYLSGDTLTVIFSATIPTLTITEQLNCIAPAYMHGVQCQSLNVTGQTDAQVINCTTLDAQHVDCTNIDVTQLITCQAVSAVNRIEATECRANFIRPHTNPPIDLVVEEFEAMQVDCAFLALQPATMSALVTMQAGANITGDLNCDNNILCDEDLRVEGAVVGVTRMETPSLLVDNIGPSIAPKLLIAGFSQGVEIWNTLNVRGAGIFRYNVTAPNIASSGSFTHCHVCEPEDQVVDWASLTGRLVESTGDCAVRDDDGLLVTDFKLVPGLSYAMPSVRVADTSVLGVLLSVENVLDNSIEHPHGITLTHEVQEDDGFKMLRVCGAGDCFVWTVRALGSEVPLTASMLGGLYTRFENGIEQNEKVILTCNSDFSFQMTTAASSNAALAVRVTQLEALIAQLTNNM